MSCHKASKVLNIAYNNAKVIYRIYKNEKRIRQTPKQQKRHAKTIRADNQRDRELARAARVEALMNEETVSSSGADIDRGTVEQLSSSSRFNETNLSLSSHPQGSLGSARSPCGKRESATSAYSEGHVHAVPAKVVSVNSASMFANFKCSDGALIKQNTGTINPG